MKTKQVSAHIFTIDNFWTKQECKDFISKSEELGYEAATVDTDKGAKVIQSVRNNNRVIYTDFELAKIIWKKLQSFAPDRIGNSIAVGLNEMFRFYRYQPGQEFKKHIDQSFIRSELEASYYTFMIYLNEDYEGGSTTFSKISIQPRQGMALIFLHSLEHEGSAVTRGIKYVLRTDIMYQLNETE